MSNPWELYDLLIDDIADTILVTGNVSEGQWTHVATDDNSLGVAYAMSSYTDRTPDMHNDTMTGKTLVEVAQLAKSWDFSLASVGMAAINMPSIATQTARQLTVSTQLAPMSLFRICSVLIMIASLAKRSQLSGIFRSLLQP